MKFKPSFLPVRFPSVPSGVVLWGLIAALPVLVPEVIAQQETGLPTGATIGKPVGGGTGKAIDAAPSLIYSKVPPGGRPPMPKEFFRTIQAAPFQPGELYLQFRAGSTPEQRQVAHTAARMVRVEHSFGDFLPDTVRVAVPPGQEQESINAYLDDPNVIYAEPVYIHHTLATVPNDPNWLDLWGLEKINMKHAWDVTTGSPDFVIGVVDSGLQWTHNDLIGNVWTNPGEIPNNSIDDDHNGCVDDVHGWHVFRNNGDLQDYLSYHGTHVAGTIGAIGNNSSNVVGVNWKCKILMVGCSDGSAEGLAYTIEAFAYILTNKFGVRVSNHSYGSLAQSETEFRCFGKAAEMGHIAVCAAGNDTNNNDGPLRMYPASHACDNIISVAASDTSDALSYFSNWGATNVDLAAPGSAIRSTTSLFSGTDVKQGTSMASPHVAGVIGLIWSGFPNLTWQQMRARILSGVTKVEGLSSDVASGGRLDAARSMAVFTQPGIGFGNGHFDDPYRNFNTALQSVPFYGQLYIKVPSSTLSGTGRIGGPPKRISPWGGSLRIGP